MTSSAQVSAVDDAPVAQTELLSQARKTWPRFALLALLTLLAWHAFHDEYGTVPLLSDIDVAVHEFGHMFFMPFGVEFLGDTMMILGGSLVQIAFPLIFVAYFLRRTELGTRRDPFAATVCLWWASINMLSVAIYCADSRAGKLMLINGQTGQESDAHDWRNLLTRWHMLSHDTIIAGRMRGVAVLTCAAALLVGAWFAARSAARSTAQSAALGSSQPATDVAAD
jgi:hypothetical protein